MGMKCVKAAGVAVLGVLLLLGSATAEDPQAAQKYVSLGLAHQRKGEADEAIAAFTKAIELDPKANAIFLTAYELRAGLYSAKGKHDEAIADCTKAIELDPKLKSRLSSRAAVYLKAGKHDEAIADYSAVIAMAKPASGNYDANQAPYFEDRGNAYRLKGKYDFAISDYTSAINLNSGGVGSYCYNRGLAYQAQGENAKAAEDFRRAVKAQQESIDSLKRSGLKDADLKDRLAELEVTKKALSAVDK